MDLSNVGTGLIHFLKVIFWEFLQNLPLLAGFCWGSSLWHTGRWAASLACIAAGGILGAVLIALTEGFKQPGYKEPLGTLFTNMAGMSFAILLMVLYLSARWSAWSTDLAIGAAAGVGMGTVQSLSARKRINIAHCLALGIASPLILLVVRWFMGAHQPLWLTILALTFLATLIIAVIDYAQDTFSLTTPSH